MHPWLKVFMIPRSCSHFRSKIDESIGSHVVTCCVNCVGDDTCHPQCGTASGHNFCERFGKEMDSQQTITCDCAARSQSWLPHVIRGPAGSRWPPAVPPPIYLTASSTPAHVYQPAFFRLRRWSSCSCRQTTNTSYMCMLFPVTVCLF